MTFKRQRPERHDHFVITCGNQECRMTFPLCGRGGLPCFVICCFCGTTNAIGSGGSA